MTTDVFCNAISSSKCLEIYYDDFNRIIEVHAVGFTKDNYPVARVWQVSGGSQSGASAGWKLLRLDRVSSIKVSAQKSEAPRSGYKPGDSAMARIVCQL